MVDKTLGGSGSKANAGLSANNCKRRSQKSRFQGTYRLPQQLTASDDESSGHFLPTAGPANHRHVSLNNGQGGPIDPDSFDDTELEGVLRNFVEPLIDILEPDYAEIVWRVEILGQPTTKIALEMGLNERTVAKRLKVGRQALLFLIMLTLKRPIHE